MARLGFLTKCLYGAYRAEEEGKQKTEGGGQELGGGQLVKLWGQDVLSRGRDRMGWNQCGGLPRGL